MQGLSKILVERNGLGKKEASAFVSAIFSIIRQALDQDKIVKVKGLGTFRIIDVDARESVNVNTGKRVLIEGHNKITFTPDALMRELVNKPFSQFETVVLKDGVDFEDMAKEETSERPDPEESEDPAVMPLVDFGDNNVQVAPVIVEEDKPELITESVSVEEVPVDAPVEEEPAPVEEISVPVVEEPVPVDEFVAEEPVVEDSVVEEPIVEESTDEEVEYDDDENPAGGKKWLMPLITCLLGLAIGYFIGNYFPFPYTYWNSPEIEKVEKAEPVKVSPVPVKTAIPKAEPEKAEPVTPAPAKPETPKPAISKSAMQEEIDAAKYEAMDARVRTGAYRIIGTEDVIKVKEGDNLMKISRRILGPDMECYLEVYNGLKASSVLEPGQEIKIPKLQLKKKKKPQTVNE